MSNDYARQILISAINKGFMPPAYEHDCADCGKQAIGSSSARPKLSAARKSG